ncbi:hypothetical protein SMKI_04G3520 [Saccharomyces mikatae IFO 1815]|uniref:F-box domain-containing protein n=1 Tax=Saccharomyces mikatae IFO 1815 TaxID=226126 RepID=A0AA35NGK2_SACMI|nr:uncharacterized protein SMKI_04G3520 [Saccharomyces mikatae IFO 1815]CAI4038013.1 hypothetical protein SMKI_04G3520 [Saccharomyces mikatae IFO 1815]
MLDRLPYDIFKQIASIIPQDDKIALTYVCKKSYESILPFVYRNIFLNETYHVRGDFDNSFGTCYWSVLNFPFMNEDDPNAENQISNRALAKLKFSYFERTLAESPSRLCPLIDRIRCTWHLNEDVMSNVLNLLSEYGSNVKFVDHFVRPSVNSGLSPLSKQLKTLTLTPPTVMPTHNSVSSSYLNEIDRLFLNCNLSQLEKLSVHINALRFFKNIKVPMKIKSLVLNLRPDTLDLAEYDVSDGHFAELEYSDIFDTSTLKQLEILSWYSRDDIPSAEEGGFDRLYFQWGLDGFWKFPEIENLSLASLVYNEFFLRNCLTAFRNLKRLKLDYMGKFEFDVSLIRFLSKQVCGKKLQRFDIHCELNHPLFFPTTENPLMRLNFDDFCPCSNCRNTINEVILKKIFPKNQSKLVKNPSRFQSRNFLFQMFFQNKIMPYTSIIDTSTPAMGWDSIPIETFVQRFNEILQDTNYTERNSTDNITREDAICLYHLYLHYLKDIFVVFEQSLPNLEYLTLNGIPTRIIQVDELQRCAVPLFYNNGYKSNSVYELVDAEALFS